MASINLSELSILLIEPSIMQRKVIVSHLQEEGITSVTGASTGKEALEIIEKYPPDLVISAMYLPDMSATELLAIIRSTNSLEDTNFMLVSSETHLAALEPIRQAGVTAILPKPFDHKDLTHALSTTLDYLDPEELELENYDAADLQILVVDDSTTARNQIKRILISMGIEQITTASNGAEAVKILKDSGFDLIITDFNMPEMDGQQLIEFIRNDIGDTYIPILMLTSEQDETRLGNVQRAGVSAICDKPFEPQAIREILHRVLDGDD